MASYTYSKILHQEPGSSLRDEEVETFALGINCKWLFAAARSDGMDDFLGLVALNSCPASTSAQPVQWLMPASSPVLSRWDDSSRVAYIFFAEGELTFFDFEGFCYNLVLNGCLLASSLKRKRSKKIASVSFVKRIVHTTFTSEPTY